MNQLKTRKPVSRILIWLALLCSGTLYGQTTSSKQLLPDAPQVSLVALVQQDAAPMQQGSSEVSAAQPMSAVSSQKPRLTQSDAEKLAIKNNPRVSVAHLLALAQHQVVREARAAELPTGTANITAEDAENASRLSAGSLTASRLFEHAGAGGGFTQLITDFGKTRNLVASSKLQEKAQSANALASIEDIVLAADQAFFNALQAQALLKVAEQNVSTRQTTETQISELTKNKLKSTLDLSFADVNLSQAKLLLLDAEGNVESTMAALDAVLGLDRQTTYDLVQDDAAVQAPPTDADQLLQLAFQQRPDLQALTYNQQAAVKFSHAQRDQMLPSISAAGTAGIVPIRPAAYYLTNWWGAIGVNMNIPVFNGFLYSAQAKEASIRAQAASEQSRDLRDRIARDVRTAWLAANTAYQRVAVTDELLREANLALSLAQTRYRLGLSSIVELSQAQFQQTDAAIGNTDAQYQYRLALATLNYETGANP
jgi:outer membrane protein